MNSLVVLPLPGGFAANSQTQAVGTPRSRALLGFFQPQDTPGYLASINLVTDGLDSAALDHQCGVARAHVAQLGARDEPEITPCDPHPHLALLQSEPTFAEHAPPPLGARFVWIGLEHIVACQPKVDWDHVERLSSQVPAVGDDDGLLRFCLPLQNGAVVPQAQVTFNPATNTFGWIVDSPDVRICGPVQGDQPGTGRGLVGFSIGPGLHQMSVVAFNGRHMLNNGYHRAVALARAGHKKIPVILVDAPSLELTPPARNGMFNPSLVFGPKPPRIVDYLEATAVEVPTKRMRFLFSVHAEQHPIPV
jgi:hypothetical protein